MTGERFGGLAQWRSAERKRLRAERLLLTAEQRAVAAQEIARHLDRLVAERLSSVEGHVISGYWPIKAEPMVLPLATIIEPLASCERKAWANPVIRNG